jgi:hypothetical protein
MLPARLLCIELKQWGTKLPEPVVNTEIEDVSIDEMWHFLNKKNEKFRYGRQWAVKTKPSAGLSAIVMPKRLDYCMTN